MCVRTGKYDEEQIRADCLEQYNVSGSGDWPVISLGGFDFSTASNIVFSNGEYDPWRIGESLFSALSTSNGICKLLHLKVRFRVQYIPYLWDCTCQTMSVMHAVASGLISAHFYFVPISFSSSVTECPADRAGYPLCMFESQI